MPGSVLAELSYAVPPADGSKPYAFAYVTDPETKERKRNFTQQTYQVEIEDLRGKEDTVSLDSAGFQLVKAESKHKTFKNDDDIMREYYPESIELLKKITGASRVVPFDHTIRRHTPGTLDSESPANRQPARLVHVDQSTAAAISRVHRHLSPAEAPDLLRRRFQIINLWRPIENAAWDWPLAFCDYRSIDKGDVIPSLLKFPDRDGENCIVKYNPGHRWKYLRGMQPDEVALIKCYDSKEDGSVAVLTPHTAFKDPTTPPDAPLRQSIELRTLVFYD